MLKKVLSVFMCLVMTVMSVPGLSVSAEGIFMQTETNIVSLTANGVRHNTELIHKQVNI